jgi:hypothetical protein
MDVTISGEEGYTDPFGGPTYRTRGSAVRKRFCQLTLATVLLMGLGLGAPGDVNAANEPFTIVNHYTGLVVDVPAPGGSTANTFTQLWTSWGGANQQFDLVNVDPNDPNSDLLLKVRNAGKCLDVNNASGDDGARVQTFACTGGPSQRWFTQMVIDPNVSCQPMTFCDNARMTIRARHTGKCLDANNPGPSPANLPKQGAALQQWTCFNNVNQFWDFRGGPPPVVH